MEKCLKRLRYEPETGRIYRLFKRGEQLCDTRNDKGYLQVRITENGKSRRVAAHRLAFVLQEGRWPAGVVDHINGSKTDNRWANLREVSVAENNANILQPVSRRVGRMNGRYYPLIGNGFECPHEAALFSETFDPVDPASLF